MLSSAGCKNKTQQDGQTRSYTKEELMDMNRNRVGVEMDLIDDFVGKTGWKMKKTETGLLYDVYHSTGGDLAIPGQYAEISFNCYLLDGTVIESTAVNGNRKFLIGEDQMVNGIHEGVTLMAVGDSARFIVPSFLAYGLTGDQNKIPSNAALVFDLSLESLD